MTEKKPKRPRDVSQLAKMMVDIGSGETETLPIAERAKDPAAVERGRAGGKARSEALTASKRQAIASRAAQKRWK